MFYNYHICTVVVVDIDFEMNSTSMNQQILIANSFSVRVNPQPFPLVCVWHDKFAPVWSSQVAFKAVRDQTVIVYLPACATL